MVSGDLLVFGDGSDREIKEKDDGKMNTIGWWMFSTFYTD
jgi:hypothetical protein